MVVCDICRTPELGSTMSAENMRQAVFENGFDLYALSLIKDPTHPMFGVAAAYATWHPSLHGEGSSWRL
jgi:hypothetical protein